MAVRWRYLENPSARAIADHLFSRAEVERATNWIRARDQYAITPLRSLESVARELGLKRLLYKDEADRFHNGSFKALGAGLAVHDVRNRCAREGGTDPIIVSATAGNYGRALAWATRREGLRCVIYVHADVPEHRVNAIRAEGAEVRRVPGNYDDAVRQAASAAREDGWILVSDTSFAGYTETPRQVMLGYTAIMEEIKGQVTNVDAIVVPAGVGGLAGAVAGWLELQQDFAPDLYVFEPIEADCIMQSALNGSPTRAKGALKTRMLGLACGEPSIIAWPPISRRTEGFLTISDDEASWGLKQLYAQDVDAGFCAGGCVGAVRALSRCVQLRDKTILTFGTEGRSAE